MPSKRLAPRVLICGLVLQFVFGMAYAWGAVAPYVRLHDHWPPLLISAVFSGTPLGYAIGIIIGGWFADRYPPRLLCWVGTGLLLIGFTLAFLLPSGITFVIFYSALALGLGGSIAFAGTLAAGIYAFPTHVGMIGGTLTGSYALAAVVQIPVISYLASTIGWMDALRLVGTIMALLAISMVLLMPAIPQPVRPRRTREAISFPQLMGRKQVWTGFLLEVTASPLGAYAFVALSTYARSLSLPLWVATGAVITVAAGNGIGRIVAGIASDRFGIDRVFLAVLAMDLLAVILLLTSNNGVALLLAALAAGIGLGGPAGLLSRLASASAPDAPNTAFGLLFVGYALGVFSGPLLGAAGGTTRTWVVLVGVAGIGLLALIFRGVLARSEPERIAREEKEEVKDL